MVEVVHVSQVEDRVYALNEAGKTVMYLIVGKKGGLLLDTGFGLCPLEPVVRKILGDKPFFVVNTHSHVDHNSGNNQFEQVYVGWMDEPQAHHILSQEDIRRNWSLERTFSPSMPQERREAKLKGWKRAVRCAVSYAQDE